MGDDHLASFRDRGSHSVEMIYSQFPPRERPRTQRRAVSLSHILFDCSYGGFLRAVKCIRDPQIPPAAAATFTCTQWSSWDTGRDTWSRVCVVILMQLYVASRCRNQRLEKSVVFCIFCLSRDICSIRAGKVNLQWYCACGSCCILSLLFWFMTGLTYNRFDFCILLTILCHTNVVQNLSFTFFIKGTVQFCILVPINNYSVLTS